MNVYDCDVFQKKCGADAAQLASAAFAHPGGGESAAAEQEPDQSGETGNTPMPRTTLASRVRSPKSLPQPAFSSSLRSR
jgi:hypothetical protein